MRRIAVVIAKKSMRIVYFLLVEACINSQFFRPGVINSNLEMSSVNFHYNQKHPFLTKKFTKKMD